MNNLIIEAHAGFLYIENMKVIFVSSEIIPFASTGGLGDVCSALPKALVHEGVDIIRFMPLYQCIDRDAYAITSTGYTLKIPLSLSIYHGSVWESNHDGVKTFFIECKTFYERPGLYLDEAGEYGDNFERYLFFQKSVIHLIDEWNLHPDVIHCNDWQTSLIPYFIDFGIDGKGRVDAEKSLLTIHNLAHQGHFPGEKFFMTQLPHECFTMYALEFYGGINQLKGGIIQASVVNTVSPTYAKEIQTKTFGYGLEKILQNRSEELCGILNGIDDGLWNPETDAFLPAQYSAAHMDGKLICKSELQKQLNLEVDQSIPLIGVVTRLVPQKGIDLLMNSIDKLIELGFQLVLLGSGESYFEEKCLEWMNRWPNQVHVSIGFSQALAHQIEAAADMFLMPSLFEPCGQNQLYSMRYGTVPIVHAVGGLKDTVTDVVDDLEGTGFVFNKYDSNALIHVLKRVHVDFQDQEKWTKLVRRIMNKDFSVKHMAKSYIKIYQSICSMD